MTVDSHNMLKVLEEFPLQCRAALDLPKGMSIQGEVKNIVCVGMGGSAIAGDLLKIVMNDTPIPVEVVRDYTIPKYVNEHTLVFALSYSGKTEETLEATEQALRENAKVVGIATGGHLAGMCKRLLRIPRQLQPRCALGYLFFPMLGVVHNAELLSIKNAELNEMLTILSNTNEIKDRAKKIVATIKDKTPLIYSSHRLEPVAKRWKTQINENAKTPAFFNTFSEMNHNEISGFEQMRRAEFFPLFIRDHHDTTEIKKRMDVVREMLECELEVEEVYIKGESLLARLFSGIYLGDFVSYYMALAKRVDPTPVHAIEELKKKMS